MHDKHDNAFIVLDHSDDTAARHAPLIDSFAGISQLNLPLHYVEEFVHKFITFNLPRLIFHDFTKSKFTDFLLICEEQTRAVASKAADPYLRHRQKPTQIPVTPLRTDALFCPWQIQHSIIYE